MSFPNFVDYVKFHSRSGKGGAGCVHFHREKFVEKGGPDGGDGGYGGHVIMRGNAQRWTLLHLKYRKHIYAHDGQRGGSQNKTGAKGKDVIVDVPLGTQARVADTQELKGEIKEHNQQLIITPGGRGGKGNTFFATSTNQSPQYAQPGEPGREEWITLELKLLADVGLVGFPNAGKSTLLSVMSAAKPKIADYPFTTLIPNLGVVSARQDQSFVMADIPGLIHESAKGKGLGFRFLRHIERNSVLLFLIASDELNVRTHYEILLEELRQYNPELLDKKRALGISKSDLLDESLKLEILKTLPSDIPVTFISSVTGESMDTLKDTLWTLLNS